MIEILLKDETSLLRIAQVWKSTSLYLDVFLKHQY